MHQTSLFAPTVVDSPIARRSDPPTSHQAAAEITSDGTRSRLTELALELVRTRPGLCANELDELAQACNVRGGEIHKRLKELERTGQIKQGEPRISTVTKRHCLTWYPVEK